MEYLQLKIAKSDDGTCKRVIGNNFMIGEQLMMCLGQLDQ